MKPIEQITTLESRTERVKLFSFQVIMSSYFKEFYNKLKTKEIAASPKTDLKTLTLPYYFLEFKSVQIECKFQKQLRLI